MAAGITFAVVWLLWYWPILPCRCPALIVLLCGYLMIRYDHEGCLGITPTHFICLCTIEMLVSPVLLCLFRNFEGLTSWSDGWHIATYVYK